MFSEDDLDCEEPTSLCSGATHTKKEKLGTSGKLSDDS